MSQTRLWAAAGIIALVLVVGFALSVPHTRDLPSKRPQASAPKAPSVVLHDSYKKGVHAITGSVDAPNPCTSASATASLVGDAGNPSAILVSITMPASSGVCLEESSKAAFSASLSAPARLPLRATVNGEPATTTSS